MLKETVGLANDVILAFAAAFVALTFAIEAVFVALLLKRTRAAKRAPGQAQPAETEELGAARTHALPEPASSVTEHATRAFEPSYAGRGPAKR